MLTYVEPTQPEAQEFSEVLSAARSQDPRAVEELFRRFYPRVQRMVHTSLATDLRVHRPWLSTRFSTGDVVQEVFRSVLLDLGAFAGETDGAFAGYLAMVVRNRILDAIRYHEAARRDGRRPSIPAEESGLEATSDDPATRAASDEELERFHAALARFPERERLLLRARFEDTATFQELADQLGFGSASAARRAFYSAQARLASELRPR